MSPAMWKLCMTQYVPIYGGKYGDDYVHKGVVLQACYVLLDVVLQRQHNDMEQTENTTLPITDTADR